MLGKGCLIVMLVAILAVLGACSVLFIQQCSRNPPADARYIVEVRNEAGQLINEFLVSKYEKDGDTVVLPTHYSWEENKWVYHKEPLRITPKWGKVTITERRD